MYRPVRQTYTDRSNGHIQTGHTDIYIQTPPALSLSEIDDYQTDICWYVLVMTLTYTITTVEIYQRSFSSRSRSASSEIQPNKPARHLHIPLNPSDVPTFP